MTIYLDKDYKCHVENDGAMTPYETDFFDGKCAAFIEGHRLVPDGDRWTREDGVEFGPHGTMFSPWKSSTELERAQLEHELEQLKAENADLQAALERLGVSDNE